MQLALRPAGTCHHRILPSSSPMERVLTCSNPSRVSGASAWFLGSRRGTLGWEIRQPPRYYKQLLLITRPASSPLSAHNLTRNPGAHNDDVGGNFQFQALLEGWAPSVTWNLSGTDFFFRPLEPPALSSDGQEVEVERERRVWSERAWVSAVVLLMRVFGFARITGTHFCLQVFTLFSPYFLSDAVA